MSVKAGRVDLAAVAVGALPRCTAVAADSAEAAMAVAGASAVVVVAADRAAEMAVGPVAEAETPLADRAAGASPAVVAADNDFYAGSSLGPAAGKPVAGLSFNRVGRRDNAVERIRVSRHNIRYRQYAIGPFKLVIRI